MGNRHDREDEYVGSEERLRFLGPHRFTRNPQCLGNRILFVGANTITNSSLLWISHGLLILVFVVASESEEAWLEDQYGQVYREYRRDIPRFWLV